LLEVFSPLDRIEENLEAGEPLLATNELVDMNQRYDYSGLLESKSGFSIAVRARGTQYQHSDLAHCPLPYQRSGLCHPGKYQIPALSLNTLDRS